jgi:glyoxylase-like metal-dependent hydrolase (beta-lactamase superfamily II)
MGLARRVREASGAWVAMHEADANPKSAHHFDVDDFRRASDEAMRRRGGLASDLSLMHQGPMPDASVFREFDLAVDRYLPDGERPLGPGSGLVSIHTPGHTLGHTCFYDTDRNLLITGDHILPRITPNISPFPGQDDDLLGIYLGSLRALAGIPAEEVLPAHEYRFRGLAERVRGLLAHHQERLAEVLAAVLAAPGCTSVAAAEALKWSRPWAAMVGPQRRFAIGEAYSHLVYLERTGCVANKGLDVDSWYPLRETGPTLT